MKDADDQFLAYETVEFDAVLHGAGDPGRPGEDQQAADALLRQFETGLGDLLQNATGDRVVFESEDYQGTHSLQQLPDLRLEDHDDQQESNTEEVLQNLGGKKESAPVRDTVEDTQTAETDKDMIGPRALQPHVKTVDQRRYDEYIQQVD